jgi:hypothetical protein
MSAATISPPTTAPRTRDRDTAHLQHPSRPEPKRPWTWALLESLAYAGAAFDPAAALAAQRLARIRDQELHTGRG